MPNIISEDMIEQAAIKLLKEAYNYNVLNCFITHKEDTNDNTGRENKRQVVLKDILYNSLCRINPEIPEDIIKENVQELSKINKFTDLMQINYENYQKIRYGINVEYKKDDKTENNRLMLIDFNNIENNNFTVASQMWIDGGMYWRRPDLIIFINGLPLVFIELKNSNIIIKNAYDKNLKDYLRDIPNLFNFNQICVLSNGLETRLGSFMAGYEHFFEWLKIENEKENPDRKSIKENAISLEYFLKGLCKPETLLDYIENFILFESKTKKILAKNHQFLGVNNAYNAFINRDKLHGKLGVFWHTQGSGKSYSMVMFARKIKHKLAGNYTFLIVTDRDDLDRQIYKNFLRTEFISDKEKVQPANSKELREALKTNKAVIFTLIHKFRYDKGKDFPILSERDDIIVIVDEAHRTQYKDLAENMRKGLPNAQYIAFTGTPLLGSKRLTNAWFGDYVSEYNFAESIKDNATVPLYYIKRVPEVELQNDYFDSDFIDIIEDENLTDAEQRRLENKYSKVLEVIKRDDRLDAVAKHIAYHFPRRGFLGKGMVISVDKFTAVRMYEKVNKYFQEEIKDLNNQINKTKDENKRNELKAIRDYIKKIEMAVVISEDADEKERFNKENLAIEPHRARINKIDENGKDIEDNFKDPEHPLQLVFVCAMWLTGFDAPSVSTLYLDKPMKGHTLMQTIARANRVFPNKECGIIVDYINVFRYLQKALVDYAADNSGDMPVRDIALLFEQLKEAIEMTKSFCLNQGIDLSRVITDEDTFKNLSLFEDFANIILSNDEVKNEYKVHANTVAHLYESLRPDIFKMEFNPVYKDAILYLQGIIEGKIRPEKLEAAQQKINALLDESIVTSNDAKTYTINENGKELDLSKINIEELKANFKQAAYKNMAIANLREYIEEKLRIMLERNSTRDSFAERFRLIIEEYNAGGSLNDEFYERLIKFMEELKAEEERHIKEELTEEELEIFDLLKKDGLTKEENKKVKLAAKKLYETLTEKKKELFIVGWYNDPQPKEKVRNNIVTVLDMSLPECYEKDIFNDKTNVIFNHIIEQAMAGYNWVA